MGAGRCSSLPVAPSAQLHQALSVRVVEDPNVVFVSPKQAFNLVDRAVSDGQSDYFGRVSSVPAEFAEIHVLGDYDEIMG